MLLSACLGLRIRGKGLRVPVRTALESCVPGPARGGSLGPRAPVGGGTISIGGCGVQKDPRWVGHAPTLARGAGLEKLPSRSGRAHGAGHVRSSPSPRSPPAPRSSHRIPGACRPHGPLPIFPVCLVVASRVAFRSVVAGGVCVCRPSCACVWACTGASVSLCSVGSPCVQCRLSVWMVTPHEGAFDAGFLPVCLSADCARVCSVFAPVCRGCSVRVAVSLCVPDYPRP